MSRYEEEEEMNTTRTLPLINILEGATQLAHQFLTAILLQLYGLGGFSSFSI
jgi:hypothetical protein